MRKIMADPARPAKHSPLSETTVRDQDNRAAPGGVSATDRPSPPIVGGETYGRGMSESTGSWQQSGTTAGDQAAGAWSTEIVVTDAPAAEDLALISDSLDEFNVELTGIADRSPYWCVIRRPAGLWAG